MAAGTEPRVPECPLNLDPTSSADDRLGRLENNSATAVVLKEWREPRADREFRNAGSTRLAPGPSSRERREDDEEKKLGGEKKKKKWSRKGEESPSSRRHTRNAQSEIDAHQRRLLRLLGST